MPELPEVETTLRGLQPHLLDRKIRRVQIHQPKLRWPVPEEIYSLKNAVIQSLQRRAKYLIISTGKGHMIWHLGMSGSLRLLPTRHASVRHEHIKIGLDDGISLRYRDPRRFGFLLYTRSDPLAHKLLSTLGPEPLTDEFNAHYLQQSCKRHRTAIKNLIMDSRKVVGIGNIYACESLFMSRINPKTKACTISLTRMERLVDSIKSVLRQAIEQGGTTLQDFTQTDGKPGYFGQSLNVYGQKGDCPDCGKTIKRIIIAQRSTYYCSNCQN